MDLTQSSTTASVDPDRVSIQYFEKGGANPQKDPIVIIPADNDDGSIDDGLCVTFSIKNEDHTLGNILQHIIMQNPDVEFCGYSVPHPSEAKIHLRIQAYSQPAVTILRAALDELQRVCGVFLQKFDHAMAQTGEYEIDLQKEI